MKPENDMQAYTFQDILDYMNTGQPFSLRVVTYDKQRKKGGELKYYKEAILLQPEKEDAEAAKLHQRPLTTTEATANNRERRDPNHHKWFTRNIRLLENGFPTSLKRKVHIILITEFNGREITP